MYFKSERKNMFHINIIENRKFNCACNNRGMMTIEACIIIPMIIFISLLLIWTGILLYNKSAVNFALAAGLDAGEENAEADNEELCTIMKLKTEELLKDRLILVKDPGIEAVTEYGRLNLKLDAFMQAPPVPLTADAGVGKTAIIEELANMIVSNKVPEFLKNKKIISLNIASIISGTKYRGEFEEKLTKILKECESNNNIIIFIDEIHTIVGAGGAEGAIDASNILKPILARGTLKIIGATTINEYKKYIAEDKALDRRFQKVLVKEPSIEETYNILKKIKREYELFHNVKISKKVLKSIVDLSNKYIFDRNNPDKSIDILDEACAYTTTIDSNIFT